MDVKDFDYELPEELIAQDPLEDRSSSRLMVLDKTTGNVEHHIFKDILEYLKPGDCLVINDTKVITSMLVGTTPDMLKTMADKVTDKLDDVVVVLAGVNGEKLTFVCACSKKAIAKGLKAGDIVKKVAMIAGGNGGGKPDMAMAGGKNVDKTDEAIFAVKGIVEEILGA